MVAGGLIVKGHRINDLEQEVSRRRKDAGISSEFSWKSYRGGNRKKHYESLVDFSFSLVEQKKAAMHVIIAKFEGVNHKELGSRAGNSALRPDRDTSVNRMYFQLFLHRVARYYGKQCAIHMRLDAGNDCADIIQMRNQLCAQTYKRYSTKPNCVRSIEPMDSKNSGIIQMSDVLVGAIAAHRNGRELKSAKAELRDYVLDRSGRPNWSVDTHKDARFMTVWNFKYNK